MDMMVTFLLLANVCRIGPQPECHNYLLMIGSRHVCESRKAGMLEALPWLKAEDYGWPKGTQFNVDLECSAKVERLGA